MLTETTKQKIEISEDNFICVSTASIVLKDGKEISKIYHNVALSPLDDVSSHDQRIQDIAKIVFTDEIKEAYRHSLNNSIGK